MSKLSDRLDFLDTVIRSSAKKDKVSNDCLRAAIADNIGFDPRTIDNYIKYLVYFKYVKLLDNGEWSVLPRDAGRFSGR